MVAASGVAGAPARVTGRTGVRRRRGKRGAGMSWSCGRGVLRRCVAQERGRGRLRRAEASLWRPCRGARLGLLSFCQEEEDDRGGAGLGQVGRRPRRKVRSSVLFLLFLFYFLCNLFAHINKISMAFLKFPNYFYKT